MVTELKMISQEVSCAVLGTTYLSRVLVQYILLSVEQLVTELRMISQEVSRAVLGTTYLSRVLVQ